MSAEQWYTAKEYHDSMRFEFMVVIKASYAYLFVKTYCLERGFAVTATSTDRIRAANGYMGENGLGSGIGGLSEDVKSIMPENNNRQARFPDQHGCLMNGAARKES